MGAVLGVALSCSDPAPPEPEVASIELSVPVTGTAIRFRDPLVVRATPQAALGVPLERDVTWSSVTPALLSVQPLAPDGDSARIQATGVGTGQVRVAAGSFAQTFDVTVQDTVFSVTVTPGALALVAGDTVTYRATVPGPPNADQTVSWVVSDETVLQRLTSPDPTVLRVQARSAGAASVRATALADPTKAGTSSVTSQVGKLVFVVQPSTTSREVPFSVPPRVEIQDVAGNRSARAASRVTLSTTQGSCDATVTGRSGVDASGGTATFDKIALSAQCQSVTLLASATPPAATTTSQLFAVTARGCDAVVPFAVTDTIVAVVESGDCIVMRGGRQYLAHTYTLTVPATAPGGGSGFRLNTVSDAFAPRVESYLWQQDPQVYRADSLPTPGTLSNAYWLLPGAYRFVVTAPIPGATGNYSRVTAARSDTEVPGQPWASCLITTTPGVSINSTLTGGDCQRPFISRSGESPGRQFLVYLRAGKSIQVTYRPIGSGVDNDAYLEAFDVTNTSDLSTQTLIGFDDNSGGGERGMDALLVIQPVPHGRFVLLRAARVGGQGTSFLTLTISG